MFIAGLTLNLDLAFFFLVYLLEMRETEDYIKYE